MTTTTKLSTREKLLNAGMTLVSMTNNGYCIHIEDGHQTRRIKHHTKKAADIEYRGLRDTPGFIDPCRPLSGRPTLPACFQVIRRRDHQLAIYACGRGGENWHKHYAADSMDSLISEWNRLLEDPLTIEG